MTQWMTEQQISKRYGGEEDLKEIGGGEDKIHLLFECVNRFLKIRNVKIYQIYFVSANSPH